MKTSSDSTDVTDYSDTALVITRPGLASIQRLGTTAWVVLEALALEAVVDDGALVVRTSARAIAEAVSASKDTAAGALRRLADAGLVERRRQHRAGGRFGAGSYVLLLPAGLATNALAAVAHPGGTDDAFTGYPTSTHPVLPTHPSSTPTPRPTHPPQPPPGPLAMSPTSLLPNHPSHPDYPSLSPPATRTHEFASSDASVSRDLFRDVPWGVPARWSPC